MRIGIDIDGVLTDERRYLTDYGTKYFYEKQIPYIINKYGYYDTDFFNIKKEEYHEYVYEYIMDYAKDALIRPFAAEIIQKMKNDGNEIYIITARSYTTHENEHKQKMQELVRNWLEKNNVIYDELIFSNKKLDICKEYNIDLMIEDKPETISSISTIIPVICFDHAYNEDLQNDNIIRCYSWYDIYSKIEKIKELL